MFRPIAARLDPRLRAARRAARPLAMAGGLLALVPLAVGAWVLARVEATQPQNAAAAAPTEAARPWTKLPEGPAAFSLTAPEWAGIGRRHAAFTRDGAPGSGGRDREDRLALGAPERGPFALITLRRGPAKADPFFVGSVRVAAEAEVTIERFGRPDSQATPWGPVETAPVALGRPAANIPSRSGCQAIRASWPDHDLLALVCPETGASLDVADFVCSIRLADGTGPAKCPASAAPSRPMRVSAADRRRLAARARQ